MRIVPSQPDDNSDPDSFYDRVLAETKDIRRKHEYDINVHEAVDAAIKSVLLRIDDDPDRSTISNTHDRVLSTIKGSIPDEFEYELEHDPEYGWTLRILSGCPNCGNEQIFNGKLMTENQWVGYDTADDGNPICGIDDGIAEKITYLGCGRCYETLVDTE
jgi:hypothetical protein